MLVTMSIEIRRWTRVGHGESAKVVNQLQIRREITKGNDENPSNFQTRGQQ